jgi:glycerol-3-phosphate responsive antiterminator
MAFIDEIKESKSASQTRRNKVKKAKQKQENTIRQFTLGETEIENIFDIIEKEHPDL